VHWNNVQTPELTTKHQAHGWNSVQYLQRIKFVLDSLRPS